MSFSNDISVVMILNYYSHHQSELSKALYKETHGNYTFIETAPMEEERKNMGWSRDNLPSFVKQSYTSAKDESDCMKLCCEADVVIIGSAPEKFIEERLKQNKLTFRYYERFFKQGRIRILDPRVFASHYKKSFKNRKKNLYVLCAGAYTAPDCRFILSYPNKTYKWGYFPELDICNDIDGLIESKIPHSILWAGRQISWKHPECVIHLAKRLKSENTDFVINMIGDGDLHANIEYLVKKENLQKNVKLLGSMQPDKVRQYMRSSQVFLFTSDRNEGWGAVLNEAMSSCCGIVANREIGSVPYLIQDGKNGLIYDRKDKNSLYRCVKKLIDNEPFRKELGKNAYNTIKDVWNADVAAKRFLHLVKCINSGAAVDYNFGPCSKDF